MFDPTLDAILRSWSFPPTVVVGLTAAAALYWRGLITSHSLIEHGPHPRWRSVAFAMGLTALALALMSPVAPLGGLLFSAHMIQHMLLAIMAAPLIVVGAPLGPVLRGLPGSVRASVTRAFRIGRPLRRIADVLTRPLVAAAAHAVTIWFWHVPGIYDATLRVESLHYLQHATILVTALLFWWPVAQPTGACRLPPGVAMLYLTAGMVVQHKLLGTFLTFARQPLYPYYTQVPRLWGVSPLSDQQTAGLIMSTGGFMIIWIAFTAVFVVWAREAGRKEERGRLAEAHRLKLAGVNSFRNSPGHERPNGVNGHVADDWSARAGDRSAT